MKRILFIFFFCTTVSWASSSLEEDCSSCRYWLNWFKPICYRFHQIWAEGRPEVYMSGYAWHNRYTYSHEKIIHYNETAWGGGLGKGMFDEKGNWQGLFAIAFLDSHSEWEPTVGYSYLKVKEFTKDLKFGIGYAAFLTSRTDMLNRAPIPGILPWISIFLGKVTLAATYIPGTSNNGNVLFMLGKYTF